jgi:hypothetical protein
MTPDLPMAGIPESLGNLAARERRHFVRARFEPRRVRLTVDCLSSASAGRGLAYVGNAYARGEAVSLPRRGGARNGLHDLRRNSIFPNLREPRSRAWKLRTARQGGCSGGCGRGRRRRHRRIW